MLKFINALTGNPEETNAGGLSPVTQNVTAYPIPYYGLRLVLVDTPGLDVGFPSDMEILESSADWLTKKYVVPQKVSCVPSRKWYIKVSRRRDAQTRWGSLPPPNHGQSHIWSFSL